MFRRPKKPSRPRVITMDISEEGDDMESVNNSNNGQPSKVQSTLLSFDHEDEGDGNAEIFKVKKSSVSRRLMKEKKKKEINKQKEVIPKAIPSSSLPSVHATTEPPTEDESILKVTNFIRILTGREAEAVNMESEDEEKETVMKFKPRPATDAVSEVLRRTLEQEKIPDANLIHEIRKRRQMARDGGSVTSVPFISMDDSVRYKSNKSRLIREDENDQSEDDDEKRIDFTIDSSQIEKEKRREAFHAAQNRKGDNLIETDSDDEVDEWERQQIRKGVSQVQLQLAAQQHDFQIGDTSSGDFRTLDADLSSSTYYSKLPILKRTMEDIMGGKTLLTVDFILRQLNDRLDGLQLGMDRDEGELSRLQVESDLLDTELQEAETGRETLSTRLRLYQGIHYYVTDLIDCLQCKIPEIEKYENQLLGFCQAHAEVLMKRRWDDKDDEYKECTIALLHQYSHSSSIDPEIERRGIARNGRRVRRRKQRQAFNIINHNEGYSSDDEELEFDIQKFKTMRDGILSVACKIFDDVEDEYCEIDKILERLHEWKSGDMDVYRESYVSLCIPKILSPILKLHLLHWNPVKDGKTLLELDWMKPLLKFNFAGCDDLDGISQDPDMKLIPSVVERVVLPWIERIVTAEYDPLSSKQTSRLRCLIQNILNDYTINILSKQIQNVLESIVKKYQDSTEKDIFIPLFDKGALLRCSEASTFTSRQFYVSVKLFENICSWVGIVNDRSLQMLALDRLLQQNVVLGIRVTTTLEETVKRAQIVVDTLPKEWLTGTIPNPIRHLIRNLMLIAQENSDLSLPSIRNQMNSMSILLLKLGAKEESEIITAKYC